MERKLKVVRFWLIGVFVIVVAAMFAFDFIIPGSFMAQWTFWLGIAFVAVVCLAFYYIYRWALRSKEAGKPSA